MGGTGFPPCWLFGLRRPGSGAYILFGAVMVDSGRAQANEYFPDFCCPCPCPCGEPQPSPSLCRRPSNTSRWVWCSLLRGHCSFPLGPDMQTTWCASSESGVCVFPSPVEVLQSNPTNLQSLILWEFLLLLLDPQVGSELQWVDFCGIYVLQSVSHPPSSYGI